MYISITGLKLKRPWYLPVFLWYAITSMRQVKSACGNVFADARTIKGVHHTLSAWESRKAMLAYVHSGAHRRAVKVFDRYFTGKTGGFEAEAIPSWDEIPALYDEHAKPYVKRTAQN